MIGRNRLWLLCGMMVVSASCGGGTSSGGTGGVGGQGGAGVDGAAGDGDAAVLADGAGPDGGASDAAGASKLLVFELPAAPPVGAPFPILIRTSDGTPLDAVAMVDLPGVVGRPVALHRGRGSLLATASTAGSFAVAAVAGDFRGTRTVTVTTRSARTLAAGSLVGGDLTWDAAADIILAGTVLVPTGQKLTIAAGTRVLAAPAANLDVTGEIVAQGTEAEPILFSRRDAAAWGGVKINAGGKATLRHVLFTASGGDATRRYGHTDTQPAVWADRSDLTIEGGGMTDLAGKGLVGVGARVNLKDTLLSRAAMGAELDSTEATIDQCWFLELPDGDGAPPLVDDDADGVHLGLSGNLGRKKVLVKNSVFAVTDDDAIDQAGADVDVQGVFVDRVWHEGVAASTSGAVTVTDTVVRGSGQGIEAGNGGPFTVTVKNVLLVENGVGLRWGDEYTSANDGTITASYVVVMGSSIANTRNLWTGGGNVSRPASLQVSCSMVDSPDHDGMQGNVAGKITWDANGCVDPGKRMLANCPDDPIGPRCP